MEELGSLFLSCSLGSLTMPSELPRPCGLHLQLCGLGNACVHIWDTLYFSIMYPLRASVWHKQHQAGNCINDIHVYALLCLDLYVIPYYMWYSCTLSFMLIVFCPIASLLYVVLFNTIIPSVTFKVIVNFIRN